MIKKTIKRRGFLKAAAGAAIGIPTIITSDALGRKRRVPASDRIVMACIGPGRRGKVVLKEFMRSPEIQVVAVCDVKEKNLESGSERVNDYYDLFKSLHQTKEGGTITLKIISGKKNKKIPVKIGIRPNKINLDVSQFFRLYMGTELGFKENKEKDLKIYIDKIIWDYDKDNKIIPGSIIHSFHPSLPYSRVEKVFEKSQLKNLVDGSYIRDDEFIYFTIYLKKNKYAVNKSHRIYKYANKTLF